MIYKFNLNRNDTKFEQKVRNMVSHRENNELLKYCEYRRVGNNGVLRSRALPQFEKEDEEKEEIEARKEKKRRFRARRVNFEALNIKNQELGLKGEEFVLNYEKGRLNPILSEKVIHVSVEEGDGAGYDILSYDDKGKPKFIEVKTTTGAKDTEFYLTENEKAFIEEYKGQVEIVRVFNFDMNTGKGEIFRISGEDLYKKLALKPVVYKVSFI